MLSSATLVLAYSGSFAFAIIFTEHVPSCAVHVLRVPFRRGDFRLNRAIILDCQTQTATPCSEDCIAYKTCSYEKLAAKTFACVYTSMLHSLISKK